MFIEGFGLYRNTYRTYIDGHVPGSLSFKERTRRANVFPITLGPHGSNFSDVVEALKSPIPLDRGIEMDLDGKRIIFCVYIHYFIGDMPQQQVRVLFRRVILTV